MAVVTLDNADHALPLADALLAGGIRVIELTYRTQAAPAALRLICAERPDLLAGAGTVLSPDQARDAREAGAAFAVSPGLNPDVVRAAGEINLPFFPGVMTPSDIESALALGCRLLKFFPAEPCGGVSMLKALAAPYAHTGVSFIPLGGITADTMRAYLDLPITAAIGGSWIATPDLIRSGRFDTIAERARECSARAAG